MPSVNPVVTECAGGKSHIGEVPLGHERWLLELPPFLVKPPVPVSAPNAAELPFSDLQLKLVFSGSLNMEAQF